MFQKSHLNAFNKLRNAAQSTRRTLKNALYAFKSVPNDDEKLQKICDLIESEGERYGLDAHDVGTVVKQFDLGPDEIHGLSSRIFYICAAIISFSCSFWETHFRYKQPRKYLRCKPKRTISSRR